MQYRIDQQDLALVLALVRGRNLSRAAQLLRVDASTVFRAIRRLETALATQLFEKGRQGYQPSALALALAQQAQTAEAALEVARASVEQGSETVSGTVRITCTDAVLHALLLPALGAFMPNYPALMLELATSNEFASLTRRDADIAVRLTRAPPEHLVGNRLREVHCRVYASPHYLQQARAKDLSDMPWVGLDDFMPHHTTVLWRRQYWPSVRPTYAASSMHAVVGLVRAGLGVAVLPEFLAQGLEAISEAITSCESALWILTRPDCRKLSAVQALFSELGARL